MLATLKVKVKLASMLHEVYLPIHIKVTDLCVERSGLA